MNFQEMRQTSHHHNSENCERYHVHLSLVASGVFSCQ
ncbi:hypothetical protein EBCG_03731 [Escherichia marmotae]|nr:hypothetical protein EBCG_03731 [Escherichia marmotae]